MNDNKCKYYAKELKIKWYEIEELKISYEKMDDEDSKLGLQYDQLIKEKDELNKKISFLEGQIEAYQYCMNCRR